MIYPKDITEDEVDQGFQLLEVDGLGEFLHDFLPAVAVVKILSPFEILVKTDAGYDHLIFGTTNIPTRKKNPIWQCTFEKEIRDAAQFLHEYELGLLKEGTIPLLERCPFSYREI